MPHLFFAAICLLFGSNFILMSRATTAFGPVAVAAGRVFGAAVVLVLAWWFVTPTARVSRDKWLKCFVVGLVANAYPYVMQPYLIGRTLEIDQGGGHSFFGMMVVFTPLITILVSAPMLGVLPAPRQLVGVLAGLGFMALLLQDGSSRGITPAMLAMAMSIPLSYALANTYLRRSLNDVPPIALSTAMLVGPVAVLAPMALADAALLPPHLAAPAEPTNWATAIAAVALLGALGTGLTMWLFVTLVQQQGPLFAGMVTYVVPLVALLWGWVDNEQITSRQLLGITGVLAMVALVQTGSATTKPASATKPPDPAPAADSAAATGEV